MRHYCVGGGCSLSAHLSRCLTLSLSLFISRFVSVLCLSLPLCLSVAPDRSRSLSLSFYLVSPLTCQLRVLAVAEPRAPGGVYTIGHLAEGAEQSARDGEMAATHLLLPLVSPLQLDILPPPPAALLVRAHPRVGVPSIEFITDRRPCLHRSLVRVVLRNNRSLGPHQSTRDAEARWRIEVRRRFGGDQACVECRRDLGGVHPGRFRGDELVEEGVGLLVLPEVAPHDVEDLPTFDAVFRFGGAHIPVRWEKCAVEI